MKSLPILFAALIPTFALAQSPPAAPANPALTEPQAAPAGKRLPKVMFSGADLGSIVEFLQARDEEEGAGARAFNVIVSPGLEKKTVPSLTLRNVTATEVLSIACRVLSLEMEPVVDEQGGEVVAWIVKESHGGGAGMAGADMGAPPTANAPVVPRGAAASPEKPTGESAFGGAGTAGSGGAGTPAGSSFHPSAPPVVELASGGGGLGAPTRTTARVFGIAPLIASTHSDPNEREKERGMKFDRLVHSLQVLARDHGQETDVKAYGEMDIIVVKSADAGAIQLISEAIEAMKMNVPSASDVGASAAREQALQTEMAALRAKIEMLTQDREQVERQATGLAEELKRVRDEAEKSRAR